MERYCIVRDDTREVCKSFSKWHETLETAKQEAERLCSKEGKEFIVLKVVGRCSLASMPVVWEGGQYA